MSAIELIPIEGIGEVEPGDSLAELIAARGELREGDVVCVSQKVVSKAEGRLRDLRDVEPSGRALQLAELLGKDPALVELVLAESRRVVRAERGVLITETHSGLVCANAGIDASNVPGSSTVALLPVDPDQSARALRGALTEATGLALAVIIADSFGRPWRVGQSEVAIGCAGVDPLDDWRGRRDALGHELRSTAIARADQIAAAADLTRHKAAGTPAVIVRGLEVEVGPGDGPGAGALQRAADEDLFR